MNNCNNGPEEEEKEVDYEQEEKEANDRSDNWNDAVEKCNDYS